MNALFVLRPAKLWAFNFGHPCPPSKKGEVLLLGLTEPTMVGDCNCLEVCFKNRLFLQPITAVFRTAVQSVKTLYIFENGVWGVAPSGVRAAAPHSAPARMPGRVCRKALHDAEPTKHTQPFPRGRGLGLGIENKHFFGKTDFFYSLEPPCFARRFYTYVQNTQNPADNFGYNLTFATLQRKAHCVILSTTKQKGAVYESTT